MNSNNEKLKQLKQEKKDMEKEIAALSENGTGSKIKNFLLLFALLTLFLGILAGMIKMDIGGFGSGILAPVIGNISGLNKILPDKNLSSAGTNAATSNTGKNNSTISNSSPVTTAPAAVTQPAAASHTAANATGTADVQTTAGPQPTAQTPTAPPTAAAASQPSADTQTVSPSQAAAATKAATDTQTTDSQAAEKAKLADYVDTYSKMDAKSAASILGNMTGDLQLVAKILTNMKASKRADIMANLDVNTASKLTVLMDK